jgi:hypothetical protein
MGKYTERLELIDIDRLIPYANNARTHSDEQIRKIQASLREFGFVNPVLIDKGCGIIAGHGRVEAAKREGIKKVPCVWVEHLTEAQKKAYILADNRLAEDAGWDMELLSVELEELKELDFDIGLTGFDADELSDIFGEEEPEIAEDDYEVELPEEPKTKLGDIYQLGRHRLLCGDATKKEDVERLMDGKKADMVFTDSPYGINAVGDNGEVGADFGIAKKGKYKKIIADDTTETAQQAYDIYSQLCDKMILWGGNYFLDFLPPSDGWLVWDKRGESGIRNTFADGEMAWCSFHTPVRIYHQLWNGMIREGEHEKRVHPTQKPIRMLSEILQDFTNEGDIILDVFGGSGSTLIACEQTGRTCYMAELSPEYVDVIIARYEKLTGNKAVLLT